MWCKKENQVGERETRSDPPGDQSPNRSFGIQLPLKRNGAQVMQKIVTSSSPVAFSCLHQILSNQTKSM